MHWHLGHARTIGVGLFVPVAALALVEIFGARSTGDLVTGGVLVCLSVAGILLFGRVARSLQLSHDARAELAQRLSQQEALTRLGHLALTDVGTQELLTAACRALAAGLGADLAGVLELLPDRNAFVLRASLGWPAEQAAGALIAAGPRSHGGYTLAVGRPVVVRDAAAERRFALSPQMAAQQIVSGVSAPIGANGGAYGVLAAHTYAQREFGPNDVAFVENLAFVLTSSLRRRAAEASAERSHTMLEAVIEGTTDAVFVKDIEGRFLAVNARAAETLGRQREDLLGRSLHDVLPHAVADAMAANDRLVVERGTVETFEEALPAAGGQRIELTTKGPYRSVDGTLLGTFGIARDITLRKLQEQEIARSEERFRLAQDGARMGTWEVDLRTGESTWSDGLRALLGVAPEAPADLEEVKPLLHADDRAWVEREVARAYADGTPFEFECRIVRREGDLRWLLCRSASVPGDDGVRARLLGVAVDITDRKLAEEELARREETLRLAQTAAGLGAWDWNLETDELRCSEGLIAILGVEPASRMPGIDGVLAAVLPEDRDGVGREIRRVLASDSTQHESSVRVSRPSGEVRSIVNRATIVRSPDGRPVRMFGITIDETDRRRAEEEREQLEGRLRQAEKLEALGRLAGGIAHDFNNLLLAVRGYGELALRRLSRGEDGALEDVGEILGAADRAAALTRQLLAFSRRQMLNPEVLDLRAVVSELTQLLRPLLGDDVRLETTLAGEPVLVTADRAQIEQVVLNLAVNGRDAMPAGGTLSVEVCRATTEPCDALLVIADTGVGMDSETSALIFEPFFTTKGEAGTGLGLATVHGIVGQSGGRIDVSSVPGSGTTFTIALPTTSGTLATAPSGSAAAVCGTEVVLLVDDDATVRSVVAELLEERGYRVIAAADGHEAVDAARQDRVDVVVSDLVMPGLSGPDVVARVREVCPDAKAVFMSGYAGDVRLREVAADAATRFLQKPFESAELARNVRELLDTAAA